MRHLIASALLACCAITPAHSQGTHAGRTASEQPLQGKVSKNEADLQKLADQISTSREQVSQKLDAQDKRLSDLWGIAVFLGAVSAFLGALITGVVVFFSIKSTNAAVAEAKNQARASVDDWVKREAPTILSEETRKALDPQVGAALREIREQAKATLVALDAELQKTTRLSEQFESKVVPTETKSEYSNDVGSGGVQATDGSGSESPSTVTKDDDAASIDVLASIPDVPQHPHAQLLDMAQNLLRTGAYQEAADQLKEALRLLENSDEEIDKALYLKASLMLSDAFSELGRNGDAMSCLKLALQKFDKEESALVKGAAFEAAVELGILEESVEAYPAAIEYFEYAASKATELQLSDDQLHFLARALAGKSRCEYQLERYSAVLKTLQNFEIAIPEETRFSKALTAYSNLVLRAARALKALAQTDEAKSLLLSFSERVAMIRRDRAGLYSSPARFLLATFFEAERLYDDALAIYTAILDRAAEGRGLGSLRNMLRALLRRAAIYAATERPEEEVRDYDLIFNTWAQRERPQSCAAYAATALVNKAITLSKRGRSHDALEIVETVLTAFSPFTDSDVREQILKATKLKAVLER